MSTTTPTVALLGTGLMGAGMARNIAAAGLPIRVWNRTPERALALAGAGCTVASTAAEAVRGADVLVTMLYDADSVMATMESAAPGLAEGMTWLQMSTIGVPGTAAAEAWATQRRLIFLDAPVLGTRGPAEQGTLVVLASGPPEAAGPVTPVLDAVGQRTLWVGPVGHGTRLKLVANAWVLTLLEGIAQSLRLAEVLGVDPHMFMDAVAGGPLDVGYLGVKGNAMLAGKFDVAFALDGALKDAELIEDAAMEAGFRPEVVRVARRYLQQAVDDGHGGLDMAATYLAH